MNYFFVTGSVALRTVKGKINFQNTENRKVISGLKAGSNFRQQTGVSLKTALNPKF